MILDDGMNEDHADLTRLVHILGKQLLLRV